MPSKRKQKTEAVAQEPVPMVADYATGLHAAVTTRRVVLVDMLLGMLDGGVPVRPEDMRAALLAVRTTIEQVQEMHECLAFSMGRARQAFVALADRMEAEVGKLHDIVSFDLEDEHLAREFRAAREAALFAQAEERARQEILADFGLFNEDSLHVFLKYHGLTAQAALANARTHGGRGQHLTETAFRFKAKPGKGAADA